MVGSSSVHILVSALKFEVCHQPCRSPAGKQTLRLLLGLASCGACSCIAGKCDRCINIDGVGELVLTVTAKNQWLLMLADIKTFDNAAAPCYLVNVWAIHVDSMIGSHGTVWISWDMWAMIPD